MLAWIAYLMGTFIAGVFLAFVISLFFTGPSQRVEKPHRILVASLAITMGGPFVYCEAITMAFGEPMAHAVKQCFNDSPIQGSMDYFRLTKYTGDHATAMAVGSEKQGWGGTDRPVIKVSLSLQGDKWIADSYSVYCSSRLNKDGLVFPPYQ